MLKITKKEVIDLIWGGGFFVINTYITTSLTPILIEDYTQHNAPAGLAEFSVLLSYLTSILFPIVLIVGYIFFYQKRKFISFEILTCSVILIVVMVVYRMLI